MFLKCFQCGQGRLGMLVMKRQKVAEDLYSSDHIHKQCQKQKKKTKLKIPLRQCIRSMFYQKKTWQNTRIRILWKICHFSQFNLCGGRELIKLQIWFCHCCWWHKGYLADSNFLFSRAPLAKACFETNWND